MISHEHALSLYDGYFAGQLDRETVRDFHAHLNDCEECKVRLRTMRSAGPGAGFTRLGGQGHGLEARAAEAMRRNRVIMYAVLAVMICFFFFFKLKRG